MDPNNIPKVEDVEAIVKATATDVCFCGAEKTRTQSFCTPCYGKLDQSQRGALFARIGDGYEEAYVKACRQLVEAEQ